MVCDFLLYTTAAPFQNMPVRSTRLVPTHVLPSCKLDKSPPWGEWLPWAGQIEPGWLYSGDLPAAREYLFSRAACPVSR